MKADCHSNLGGEGLRSLTKWGESVGVSTPTLWRWRRAGWLDVVRIGNRIYITDEAISRFTQRAVTGEFSQDHVVPTRKFASS